ncbi:arsenate reductase (azurin) small subunit [Caenispirillum salinarum]|uniref:arsenate reductase (azurin) small subunit n=1 Tax=Caenispirillum salinarum TaxID=859058 RepID=UPI00384DEF1D
MGHTHKKGGGCLNRRQFLIFGGSALAVMAAPPVVKAAGLKLVGSRYEEMRIASLADLEAGVPIEFTYPNADVFNILVKLNEQAGGGIGPDRNIVAFNTTCTHMGGPVGADTFKPTHSVLGPCPLHLTTFDLTRHGMVTAGHATSSLPQIMLEVRNGDIYAIGVMGLVFGYDENPRGTEA